MTIGKKQPFARKAQAEMLEWFPRLILLMVATVLIVVITSYYSGREVDSAQVEMNAHFYRVYYDDIIMYKDPATGRVYPGIVDKAKFTESRLTDVFKTKDSTGEARVASCYTLHYFTSGGIIIDDASAKDNRICTDKEMVDHFTPIADNEWIGAGAAKIMRFTMPITVRDVEKGTDEIATIDVAVVKRNT
jgi:hypothetical protein